MSTFRRCGQESYALKLPIRSILSYGLVTENRFRSLDGKTDLVTSSNVFLFATFTQFGILTDSATKSFAICWFSNEHCYVYYYAMDDVNIEFFISLVKARLAIWDKSLDVYKDKILK